MKLENFKHNDWTKYWTGDWSFLSAWYWGDYYVNLMSKYRGIGFNQCLIAAQQGRSSCFFTSADRGLFGNFLVGQVLADKKWLKNYCQDIKQRADTFINFLQKQQGVIEQKTFQQFLELLYQYTAWHISPRHIIDFLPADKISENLSMLQEVRLYTEPVFKETENFMRRWAEQVGRQINLPADLVLSLTGHEVSEYWRSQNLPVKEELARRFQHSLVFFKEKHEEIVTDDEQCVRIEQALADTDVVEIAGGLTGVVAYKGKVNGFVRLVQDPKNYRQFAQGDILVTSMTRPEFLPLVKQAGAIVTDIGGLLCHAAIVSRELGIPCLIGTKIATKVFKDGDLVEVDAEKGVVKKL